jgi:hypothetical protein
MLDPRLKDRLVGLHLKLGDTYAHVEADNDGMYTLKPWYGESVFFARWEDLAEADLVTNIKLGQDPAVVVDQFERHNPGATWAGGRPTGR